MYSEQSRQCWTVILPYLIIGSVILILARFATVHAAGQSFAPDSALAQSICQRSARPAPLARVKALRAQQRPVRIVVLGSSSTAGAGATRPELGYVGQTARLLQAAWGGQQVTIFNRGVGGDTLAMEVARSQKDVYALNPDLVILQTGTNDVLQKVNKFVFGRMLNHFIGDLKRRHTDVLLVNVQYISSLRNSANFFAFRELIQATGKLNDVAAISRYDISRDLMRQAGLGSTDISAPDGLHPNDFMHLCTAQALAKTILLSTK